MTIKRAAGRQLENAEASAAAARAEVLATLQQIRHRIDPRIVVAETAERGVARVNHLLETAQGAMKRKPWLVAVGATLFGIAVAARARVHAETRETDETEPHPEG